MFMSDGEVWDRINESLTAGAWPLVALVIAIVVIAFFRKQVADRIKSIREANVGTASVKMDASREANEVLRENVPGVLGQTEPIISGAEIASEDPKTANGSAPVEGHANVTAEGDVARGEGTVRPPEAAESDDLFARAEQVEEIIRASWRAGVEAGQTGTFAEPPEPNIVWTGSKPEIKGWNVIVRPQSIKSTMRVSNVKLGGGIRGTGPQPATEQVRRLEAEIRRLRENGADMPRKTVTPEYLLYLELLEKLRRLDPKSPFA